MALPASAEWVSKEFECAVVLVGDLHTVNGSPSVKVLGQIYVLRCLLICNGNCISLHLVVVCFGLRRNQDCSIDQSSQHCTCAV